MHLPLASIAGEASGQKRYAAVVLPDGRVRRIEPVEGVRRARVLDDLACARQTFRCRGQSQFAARLDLAPYRATADPAPEALDRDRDSVAPNPERPPTSARSSALRPYQPMVSSVGEAIRTPSRLTRRQFHHKPLLTSFWRATAARQAPGRSHSATIRNFSSTRQRRRSTPVSMSTHHVLHP
jgi:hypothetical protein